MRWLGSVLGPQPPKIAGFRAEQAPRHSSEGEVLLPISSPESCDRKLMTIQY